MKHCFLLLWISLWFAATGKAQGPTPNFTAPVTSGCAPLIVNFQDLSTGNPVKWEWNLGNGAISGLQNPSAAYFTPGLYTVSLKVTNAAGQSNTLTRTAYIQVFQLPTVAFSANDQDGCAPHRVQFTDASVAGAGTTINSWFWDFGNGTQSTLQNPTAVFAAPGTYSVSLRVTTDKGCPQVLIRTAYITVTPGVQVGFSNPPPDVCGPPATVAFTNSATGPAPLTYYWNFGDGATSNIPNPSHTYTTSGSFTVTLAVTSAAGCTDTLRRADAVDLASRIPVFIAPEKLCLDKPGTFTDTTRLVPPARRWRFSDGVLMTGGPSITRTFSTPGIYTVTLVNLYPNCADSTTKTFEVLPRAAAEFTGSPTSRCQPNLTVNFTAAPRPDAVAWKWFFGDGDSSALQNPSHTYTALGSYNVQLIVTNSVGCSDTLLKPNFIRLQKPTIQLPDHPKKGCIPFTYSPNAVVNSLDPVVSWFWDFGDGATSTQQNPTHVYTAVGTYPVRVRITTSNGCTEELRLDTGVQVGTKPVADFSGMPRVACAKQPIQFTNLSAPSGTQWIWDFGDGGTSFLPNPSYAYSDTGLFTVTLITLNNGCRDTAFKTNYIRINPPLAKFIVLTNCNARKTFAFRDTSIAPQTWFWDFGDGTTSTERHPTHTYASFGTYNVSLTVTNDTCEHTTMQILRVFDESPDFTYTDPLTCKQSNIIFTATSPIMANLANFQWNLGNGQIFSGPSPTVTGTFTASGTYTITLVTTDLFGCKDSVVKSQTILMNGPKARFAPVNDRGCVGLTASFADSSSSDGRSPITQWTWIWGDGTRQNFSSSTGSFSHIYNRADTFDVRLIVRDANNCRDTFLFLAAVRTSDPLPDFDSPDTLSCPGAPVRFRNNSVASAVSAWTWQFGDGGTSTDVNPTHAYADSGRYTVQMRLIDGNGCADSLIRPLYIRIARPKASFLQSDSMASCTPFEVLFTNTSYYASYVQWELGIGSTFSPNPVVYYNAPGVFNIKLTATSPGGCTDTAFSRVTVFDPSGSTLRYTPLNGCNPLPVRLKVSSPAKNFTYTWDFGDGTLVNTTVDSVTHIYRTFGNFVPKAILRDPSGCIIPVVGPDTIRVIGAVAKFGINPKWLCDSGNVQFLDSTTFNDPIVNYTWNFGDGNTSNVQGNVNHYYAGTGLYPTYLAIQTLQGCRDTFRLPAPFQVFASPLIAVDGPIEVCVGGILDHAGRFLRTDTTVVGWQWRFPNGNSSDVQDPSSQRYNTVGDFTINAIATNPYGCADTVVHPLRVHPLPVVTAPTPQLKSVGVPMEILADYSSGTRLWTWRPGGTLSCIDCPNPYTNTRIGTWYDVAVVDSNSCRNTGRVEVIVLCEGIELFVPNTFSPNGDGSNDVFYVRGRGLERVKSLRVFNRWGEVVFEKYDFPINDANAGWNGRYQGAPAKPDVYVYQSEVYCENGKLIPFHGNVALIQ